MTMVSGGNSLQASREVLVPAGGVCSSRLAITATNRAGTGSSTHLNPSSLPNSIGNGTFDLLFAFAFPYPSSNRKFQVALI